jgi:hypothetical protein
MDTEQMAILEDAIGKEYLCAGSWQERYRRATEKYETQRILRSLSQQKRQTPRVDQPLRMPTSSAAARLWLGNIATEDELLRRHAAHSPRPSSAALHRPLMLASPRSSVPNDFGSTLHCSGWTNTDVRVGGTHDAKPHPSTPVTPRR